MKPYTSQEWYDVSSIVQKLYGGGIAVQDHVRAASFSQQQLVEKQIQQTKEIAKQGILTGPSAPPNKVDDHLLDVSDDEDIVVEDDSTATEKSK